MRSYSIRTDIYITLLLVVLITFGVFKGTTAVIRSIAKEPEQQVISDASVVAGQLTTHHA